MNKKIISVVCGKFNEPRNFLIEDCGVSFEVYFGDYQEQPDIIKADGFDLKFIEKYDDPFFTLYYKIVKKY